jgi:hypothetical protein
VFLQYLFYSLIHNDEHEEVLTQIFRQSLTFQYQEFQVNIPVTWVEGIDGILFIYHVNIYWVSSKYKQWKQSNEQDF